MPNRDEHGRLCPIVGSLAAGGLALADGDSPAEVAAKALGGYFGGKLGGRFPDLIDPPTSPNHRSVGHGVVPVGTVAIKAMPTVFDWNRSLTEYARQELAECEDAESALEAALHLLVYFGSLFAAGALIGLPAGYATHLAQDAGTKKGLPTIA